MDWQIIAHIWVVISICTTIYILVYDRGFTQFYDRTDWAFLAGATFMGPVFWAFLWSLMLIVNIRDKVQEWLTRD